MQETQVNAFGIPQHNYQIKLSGLAFEGPLDLLLQLIERNELPVTEIALAKICDEYLSYINQLHSVNPAELAEFLVIATKLIYIKSQALLPSPAHRSSDNEEDEQSAEELMVQLREYKMMKLAAQRLWQHQEQHGRAWQTQRVGPHEGILEQVTLTLKQKPEYARNEAGLHGVTLKDLLKLVERRLAAQNQQQLKLPLTASSQQLKRLVHSVKISDKISLIRKRLQVNNGAQIEFSSLFKTEEQDAEATSPLEIIITFMAMLELVRTKQASTQQDEIFGEIYIKEEEIEPKV